VKVPKSLHVPISRTPQEASRVVNETFRLLVLLKSLQPKIAQVTSTFGFHSSPKKLPTRSCHHGHLINGTGRTFAPKDATNELLGVQGKMDISMGNAWICDCLMFGNMIQTSGGVFFWWFFSW